MSPNGSAPSNPVGQPSAATGVNFSRLADQNGESSSPARSRSSGKRSTESDHRPGDDEETVNAGDSTNSRSTNSRRHKYNSPSQHGRRSGGFLLESPLSNGFSRDSAIKDRNGKRKAQDGSLYVDKRRLPQSRLSGEWSLRSSPLSREVSMDGAPSEMADEGIQERAGLQSMDPAQLVQMALRLSESRRRHGSDVLQVPLSSPRGSRAASGLSANYGTVRSRSPKAQRASYMIESKGQSSSPRELSTAYQDGFLDGHPVAEDFEADNSSYMFSPATLSRAEKVRKYFELAEQHRRLLQHLPPLKSDTSAPGNFTFVSTSSSGSALPQISRVQSLANNKHPLGRPYNPLQALRNRRIRTRERRPMTAPVDSWQDTERVKTWVDSVAVAANDASYRSVSNRVQLPAFSGDIGSNAILQESPKGHRRTETVGSVITRPENGWSIEPTELLADAYWMEAGDNKSLIENRRGNPVFPAGQQSFPNTSRKSVEAVWESRNDAMSEQQHVGDEHARGQQRSRLHVLPRRHSRMPRVSRSPSSSSDSAVEGRRRLPLLSYGSDVVEENTRPLERHMQQIIAKEERGELLSPDLVSPDHWDSKHTPFPAFRGDGGHREANQRNTAGLTVDTQVQHRRSRSADARFEAGHHAMSSNDDLASLEPSSPVVPGLIPSMGIDLTPPSHPKPERLKSRRQRLPMLRSYTKEGNNIEQTDFAPSVADVDALPIHEPPRTSQDSLRPFQMQRNKTTMDSSSSSLRRQNTATSTATTDTSSKEPGSSVGRFFKGGRIGEMVRNEGSRLGDRILGRDRPDGTASTNVDDSVARDDRIERKPTLSPSVESEASPQEYFDRSRIRPTFNLPSFTSPAERLKTANVSRPLSVDSVPISPRQEQPENGEISRFGRLPQLNLPEDDTAAERDLPIDRSITFLDQRRKSYGFLALPADADSRLPLDRRMVASHGGRHWSISDRAQPEQANDITRRDVARVRALLLSSGIKARGIQRWADTPRDKPLLLMLKAAETAGQKWKVVPKKEEHLAAARMLSDTISSTIAEFQKTLAHFQNDVAKSLVSQMEELQHKATEHLTARVHDTSDDADAFNVELTTKQPQDVKRVDDAVDAMLRRRRRQFRLIRRAGFKLLEWLVLGIMWWVWFIVVLFNAIRRIIVALLAFLRWLIWF